MTRVLRRLAERPDNPEGELLLGPAVTWLFGLVVPALMGLYALTCIGEQRVLIYGSRVYMNLHGISAVLFGVGIIGVAGLFHLQCFWDSVYDSTRVGARSKLLCVLITGACAYGLCYRLLSGS